MSFSPPFPINVLRALCILKRWTFDRAGHGRGDTNASTFPRGWSSPRQRPVAALQHMAGGAGKAKILEEFVLSTRQRKRASSVFCFSQPPSLDGQQHYYCCNFKLVINYGIISPRQLHYTTYSLDVYIALHKLGLEESRRWWNKHPPASYRAADCVWTASITN